MSRLFFQSRYLDLASGQGKTLVLESRPDHTLLEV